MQNTSVVEADEISGLERVVDLKAVARGHLTEAAHRRIRPGLILGGHIGECPNWVERPQCERCAIDAKVDKRPRPPMVDVRPAVEEDPVERGERFVVVGVFGFDYFDHRSTVGHRRVAAASLVQHTVQELKARGSFAGGQVGVWAEAQIGVGRRVRVVTTGQGDVGLNVPNRAEVRVPDRADTFGKFEVEIVVERAAS